MASKKKSMAGEALGLFTDFVNGVREELKRRDGTDEQLESLRDKTVIATIVNLIMVPVQAVLQYLDRTISITMDLSKTMAQLIADGKYDWVNESIQKHFSVQVQEGSRTTEVHLLHYKKDMSTDAVLADMDRQGLRPMTFLELLWIGIRYPELQRDFPIVALGTVQQVSGDRSVACLCRYGSGRGLDLSWVGVVWGEDFRFGAVRKSR